MSEQYKTICEEIREIKFKYWTPPTEETVEKPAKPETEYINVGFYKGDVKSTFDRKGRSVSCIAFPKCSIYATYVWFYPTNWIKENKANPEKRWVSIKEGNNITVVRSAKNADGKYETVDTKEISPTELKEAMKREKANTQA